MSNVASTVVTIHGDAWTVYLTQSDLDTIDEDDKPVALRIVAERAKRISESYPGDA